MPHKSDNFSLGDYARKVWVTVAIATAAIVVLFLLRHGFEVLLIISAGLLLALLLLVPADWLSRRSFLSRRWAMGVVLLVLLGLMAALGTAFSASIGEQFRQLMEVIPNSLGEFKARVSQWPLGSELVNRLEQGQASGNVLGQWFSRISSFLTSTFGILANLFFIVFIALFVAFEPSTYRHGFLQLIPPRRRAATDELLQDVRHKLNWWMLGRLVSMTLVGVVTSVGLWLIGMPMALSLGLLAALLVFIPNLGPLLSAIPALLVAFSEGLVLPVSLLYVGLQAVESNLITPMVDRQSVKLPPAVLISAQLSLGLIAGTLGLLMAAPLTVLVMVVIKRVYIEGWMGEKPGVSG